MKIVFISDTHGKHNSLSLPQGDVLVHAGDVSKMGTEIEIRQFLEWFSTQDFAYKIFIAGNHDFLFEKNESLALSLIPENCIYLNDSGIEIDGTYFWGSPISPWFFDWAFNRQRGEEIRKHWDLIPSHTDVLITHGGGMGTLDTTIAGTHVGCEELTKVVEQVQPKIHVFGHIHESYGIEQRGLTTFINASILNVKYKLANAPILIEI